MTVDIRPAMTSSELLLAWDAKRTAERKPGLSMSAIGGCRRRAGYLAANTPPSNPSGSVQSASGSAIHEKVAEAAHDLFPGDLVEVAVEFAGIPGTLDRFDVERGVLIDTKTTSSRWLDRVKVDGISRSWRWQTAGYAAALVQRGYTVRTIRIDVIARDTGEEWTTSRPFDPAEVREALGWVAEVKSTDLDMLPRDYEPTSAFCRGCPFAVTCWDGGVTDRDPRSVLYVQDPDAPKWAAQLWQARQDKAEAERREKEARGALDALRPNVEGTVEVDIGWDRPLVFQVKKGARRLDTKAVRAEYAKAGAEPPMKQGEPTVNVDFGEPARDAVA